MNTTVPVKLYLDFISAPSRALYIIFKVSRSNVKTVPVQLRKGKLSIYQNKNWINTNLNVTGEHLTEKFREEVNRFQKVPCIVDGQFKLAESIAILR